MRKHQRITGNDNHTGLDKAQLSHTEKPKTLKQKQKEDAIALAHLIYDIYKDEKDYKILNGHNNAKDANTP